MTALQLPYWKFYSRDWLSDQKIGLLSLEQEGALIRLMAYFWTEGEVPADPAKLARLLRVSHERFEEEIWPDLKKFFIENGSGLLEHEELALEREKLMERKRRQQEAGRRGAKKRWSKRSSDGGGSGDPTRDPNGDPGREGIREPTGEPNTDPDGHPVAFSDGRRQSADGRGSQLEGQDGRTPRHMADRGTQEESIGVGDDELDESDLPF